MVEYVAGATILKKEIRQQNEHRYSQNPQKRTFSPTVREGTHVCEMGPLTLELGLTLPSAGSAALTSVLQ